MKGKLPANRIGYAALAFLGVSVVIHFFGGITELYAVITNSGSVAYAGLMLIGVSIPVVLLGAMVSGVLQPKATYASLSGVMVLYIIAYADVHAMGYLETMTGADLHTHDHNGHDHNGHDDHNHNGHDHNGHDDHNHNGHDHNGHDDHNHDHEHGESTLDTVGDHLVDDPVALVCKISEGTAAVLFAMLSVRE